MIIGRYVMLIIMIIFMIILMITGVYYHPRHAISRELSPQLGLIRQITPKYKKLKKLKIIDKVEQSVYIGVSKGAEFKNSIYFVLRSLLHCVWA